jgi:hypothetical protein
VFIILWLAMIKILKSWNFWMGQETLHMHTKNKGELEDSHDQLASTTYGSDEEGSMQKSEEKYPASQQSLLKNWPLMSSIIVYCVFQLHDMAYTEVNSLLEFNCKCFI